MIELAFQIGVPCVFLLLGWVGGRWNERLHLRSLLEREKRSQGVLMTDIKTFPGGAHPDTPPRLVTAECVIATDYLKSFMAGIRKILGGELKSYRSLMDRARREALLRLAEQAREQGCDGVCNIRMRTADIAGNSRRNPAAMVEVYVSGTAYRRKEVPADEKTVA
mgnify:CR=1 FL=1